LLAAHTALFHAEAGRQISNVVLVGSPIDSEFLTVLQNHENIGNVVVVDLAEHDDPIHAGMSDLELVLSAPSLALDVTDETGAGHFYYSPNTEEGQRRRRELSNQLYEQGLR